MNAARTLRGARPRRRQRLRLARWHQGRGDARCRPPWGSRPPRRWRPRRNWRRPPRSQGRLRDRAGGKEYGERRGERLDAVGGARAVGRGAVTDRDAFCRRGRGSEPSGRVRGAIGSSNVRAMRQAAAWRGSGAGGGAGRTCLRRVLSSRSTAPGRALTMSSSSSLGTEKPSFLKTFSARGRGGVGRRSGGARRAGRSHGSSSASCTSFPTPRWRRCSCGARRAGESSDRRSRRRGLRWRKEHGAGGPRAAASGEARWRRGPAPERHSGRLGATKSAPGARTAVAEVPADVALGPGQRDLVHPCVDGLQLLVVQHRHGSRGGAGL